MKTYFVTGATGAVGSAVLARLLTDPEVSAYALVRAASPEAAAARLSGTLEALGATERADSSSGRVRALVGDVEQPDFGLSPKDFALLSSTCTHLIHCAGAVRMNLPLDSARSMAVGAARNIFQLARGLADAGRLAKIDMVSTVGVAGRDHRLLREQWVGSDHRFHNTYEQAKAEAEQLAHQAVDARMPVTLHRPSMVVGHSQTGHTLHFQVFYFLVEFLSGRRTRGFFPDLGTASLDIVPVDFVAEAIVRSSGSSKTTGKILHLCAGPQGAVSLRRLQALVHDTLAKQGARVPRPRYVSRGIFRGAARMLGFLADAKTRRALGTLPVFLDYLDTDQAFENIRTADILRAEGVTLPRAEDYLPRVLDFYFLTKQRAREQGSRDAIAEGHG